MEIKTIKVCELLDFINSDLYNTSRNCPITKHRAISQTKNPRAENDDPALIIAITGKDIVGYIGFLPDKINNDKVYWNSCWWVEEKYKNIAIPLLLNFIKTGQEKIILTDFTLHTKQIIEQFNFFNFSELNQGIRGHVKFNLSELLPNRNKKFAPFTFLLKIIDTTINACIHPKTYPISIQQELIIELNETDQKFINEHSQNELIKRNVDEIEWILNNPWVKNTKNKYRNYYFSSGFKNFETKIIRLSSEGKIKAIIYLRKLNNHLTTPFVYFEENYINEVVNLICNEAVTGNCITYTTFNNKLKEVIKSKKRTFITKRLISKYFAYHKSLNNVITTPIILQDGDGDGAFC